MLSTARFIDIEGKDYYFDNCDFSKSEFFDISLNGVDFSNSIIDDIRINTKDVKGMIVNPNQGIMLLSLLGIEIKD